MGTVPAMFTKIIEVPEALLQSGANHNFNNATAPNYDTEYGFKKFVCENGQLVCKGGKTQDSQGNTINVDANGDPINWDTIPNSVCTALHTKYGNDFKVPNCLQSRETPPANMHGGMATKDLLIMGSIAVVILGVVIYVFSSAAKAS